jgi:nucleotide-binding universal stress UspA family protein
MPFVDATRSLGRAGLFSLTVLRGDAETAIAEYVATAGIDLLVMGAYGHGRLRNMIVGSTTTALLRSCKIPVLVFR